MTTGLKNKDNYYLQLMTDFPPRPINNEEELKITQQRINNILAKEKLTQDDKDYLLVLGSLIYDYEEKSEPIPKVNELEILHSLINDFHVKPQDLSTIFPRESILNDLLNGNRFLTSEEATKLTDYYISHFL